MRPISKKSTLLAVAAGAALLAPGAAARQAKTLPLEAATGLRLVNVSADPVVLDGKKGLRVTVSEDALRRLKSMSPEEQAAFQTLAVVEGLEFGSGVIEAEIAGAPAPDAGEGARGFVGIAFRLLSDMKTYDTFYLRPTNGRADDQERRNHAVQYRVFSGLAVVPASQGDAIEVRGVRRSRAGGVDEDQDRSPRRSRAPLRPRTGAADVDRQRRQDRRAGQGRGRAVARSGNDRALPQSQHPAVRR